MSKTITKVIAALGVVAGLGVAVLPLASYAASESSDLVVFINVTATGVAPPDCNTGSGICDIPGTNNTYGQTVFVKDKDSNYYLCLDTVCTLNQGASAASVNAIPPISGPLASLTSGPSTTPAGYGVQYTMAGGAYTSDFTTGQDAYFHPVSSNIVTYTALAPVADTTLATVTRGTYATNTTPGTHSNTLEITITEGEAP